MQPIKDLWTRVSNKPLSALTRAADQYAELLTPGQYLQGVEASLTHTAPKTHLQKARQPWKLRSPCLKEATLVKHHRFTALTWIEMDLSEKR